MMSAKKVISIILTAVMLMSVMSVGFCVSAATCNHNIGDEFENSTMVVYSEKKATCVMTGAIGYQCTECTFTTSLTVPVDPDNHTMTPWETVTEATCDTEGSKTRHCLNCGEVENGVIPVSDIHTYADESLLDFWWTAENAGVGTERNGWTVLRLPTCTSEGLAKTICTVCGEAEKTAPIHLHSFTFEEVDRQEATCIRPGESHVYCTQCNANYTFTIPVDADNHVIQWKTVTEATCKAEGLEKEYCIWHGDFEGAETRVVEKAAHSFTDYKYDYNATCTADGTKTATCDNCDATDTVTADGTKGFCITKWYFTSGNCKDGGTAYIDCIYPNCKVEYKEIKNFAPNSHPNLLTRTVAPTCEEGGYTYIECPDCGAYSVIENTRTEATGHSYEWVNIKAASCISKQNGIKRGTCTVCGGTKDEDIVYEHNYVALVPEVPATCTKDGSTAHLKCVSCGEEVMPEKLEAFGHTDSDGNDNCDVCYTYFVTAPDGTPVDCKCLCHNPSGLAKTIFKIYMFFCRIFGTAQECDCGNLHYEKAGLLK